jgi:predicted dienelactone hydrolase
VDDRLTRRSFLGASALALGLSGTTWAAGSAAFGERVGVRLSLPSPTGPYPIGIVQLLLVDHSRRDPWVASRPRELMVSVWYPALDSHRFPLAPWIEHKAGALFLKQLVSSLLADAGPAPPGGGRPREVPLAGVRLPIVQARQGAPARLTARRYPVVVVQPGYGDVRELGTGLVSDLASRGYVVVTMDDTYEAAEVEFPHGRIVIPRSDQSFVDSVRVADTRFVLDELERLRSGVNPDAEHRRLPRDLGRALDTTKLGMFGHSLGGATAAKAMAVDRRITAGVNLDGSIVLMRPGSHQNASSLAAHVAERLGNRAFMIMTHQGHDTQTDPSLAGFWSALHGWRLFLTMKNSQHYSYTDLEEFLGQLLAAEVAPRHITPQLVAEVIGTVEPKQAVGAERAYIAAFFDLHLRGESSELLKGPSSKYPGIEFLGR